MSVTSIFYSVLHSLEDEGQLDPNNSTHLFCCHYVFLPRLQHSLNVFRDGWDNHPLRTEQNMTPNQMWAMGKLPNPIHDPDNFCDVFKSRYGYGQEWPLLITI